VGDFAIAGEDDHVAAVVGCPVACDIADRAVDSHQETVLNGPVEFPGPVELGEVAVSRRYDHVVHPVDCGEAS